MVDDEKIIKECLRAAVDGPFFPDWEFPILFGLTRAEVAAILASWPECDDPEDRWLAINSTLNNLLGYPHKEWAHWTRYISASPEEVHAVFERWGSTNSRED